jgi:hypothetical protein
METLLTASLPESPIHAGMALATPHSVRSTHARHSREAGAAFNSHVSLELLFCTQPTRHDQASA